MWIKFKFSRVKFCVVLRHSSNEGKSKEREMLWNDLDRISDREGNGYTLCMLGDLNGWVRVGTTNAFGIPGENDNGRRVVEFCAERELCVANTYFEHRSLHK